MLWPGVKLISCGRRHATYLVLTLIGRMRFSILVSINFIHDLPRFLVLLLIMQRLPYAQWGHNQLFEPAPGVLGKVAVEDEKLGTVDLQLHLDSPERVTHYGLRGRATNVFRVTSKTLSQEARKLPSLNKTDELVAKLYWPEQSRQSEAEISEEMHKISAKKAGVKDHIPEVILSHMYVRRHIYSEDQKRTRDGRCSRG